MSKGFYFSNDLIPLKRVREYQNSSKSHIFVSVYLSGVIYERWGNILWKIR